VDNFTDPPSVSARRTFCARVYALNDGVYFLILPDSSSFRPIPSRHFRREKQMPVENFDIVADSAQLLKDNSKSSWKKWQIIAGISVVVAVIATASAVG
jgi:hypothetical protein